MYLALEEKLNNDNAIRVSRIFTLAFYHDEELPTELMSVTRVNTEV